MKKRRSEKKLEVIQVRLYGIFNVKTRKMVKVSLEHEEIDMELALNTNKDLSECQSDVTLII